MNMPMHEQDGVDRQQEAGAASSASSGPASRRSRPGTPARVIRKANSPALAMMNMITADEITDLAQDRRQVGELDLAVDRTCRPAARRTPRPTDASVGVKMPP